MSLKLTSIYPFLVTSAATPKILSHLPLRPTSCVAQRTLDVIYSPMCPSTPSPLYSYTHPYVMCYHPSFPRCGIFHLIEESWAHVNCVVRGLITQEIMILYIDNYMQENYLRGFTKIVCERNESKRRLKQAGRINLRNKVYVTVGPPRTTPLSTPAPPFPAIPYDQLGGVNTFPLWSA